MKLLPLSQGKHAIVDDADYEWLSQWKWRIASSHSSGVNEYAGRSDYSEGKQRLVLLHRVIIGAGPGEFVDHIDQNGLNNTRANLRKVTRAQNKQNGRPYRGGTSQYKGVYWDKKSSKWVASIRVNRKLFRLGAFVDEQAAARAYDDAAREHFGVYARTNFADVKQTMEVA
jgi:hypothetical protein